MQAYTGVFNTPNAAVVDYGDFAFSYSDNYFDRDGFVEATDLKFGVGVLPNLEVVGRLGTKEWSSNCYSESGCGGFRDLSGSFKYKIPFIPENWFELAVGGQDIGGSAVYSEAYYISASKELDLSQFGSVRSSVGYAKSDNAFDYMNGVFGSVEYQPVDFLQVAAEYDANAVNAGLKLFMPQEWLPQGWQVSAAAQLYSSDKEHNVEDEWFSFNLTIPMGSTPPRKSTKVLMQQASQSTLATVTPKASSATPIKPSIEAKDDEAQVAATAQSYQPIVREPLQHKADSVITKADLNAFANFLADYGFESVSIGFDDFIANRLVIEFENNLYNRNEDDAMQVMAQLVSEHLHTKASINMTNFGLVVKTVTLDFSDNKEIDISGYKRAKDSNLVSNWFVNDNVDWLVKNESSSHFVPRLIVAPALASLVGTEYGAFDYQLVMSLNAQMSLWPGALVDFRYMSDTIASSDDFEDGKYIRNSFGINEGIDRRLFHQAFSLPLNVFTQFSYGRIYGNSDGLLNETRWQSDNALHRVTLLAGDFDEKVSGSQPYTINHQPILMKYRYRYSPLNWDVELTAGQYWAGDKGFTLRSLHWFDNVQVGLKYRRTKFDDREEEDFIAIGFSVPLNFKKSMNPKYGFQVKGIEQWSYYVETLIAEKGKPNYISGNSGQEPSLYHNLDQAYFNRDRY